MNCPYTPAAPTLPDQLGALKQFFPNGKGTICDHDQSLHWRGKLQPSTFSRIYRIEIRYKRGRFPRTFVYKPDLNKLANSMPIPHTFSQTSNKTELCLFWPGKKKRELPEWNRYMTLASSIVPWASLWLYYFEQWLATGEWHGGGYHDNELRFSELVERVNIKT